MYQIKQAWGSLKKKPGFVATVVVTMGTTLGALLCVLTLAYLLILQPLPYPEQDKLYQVAHGISGESGELKGDDIFTYPGLIHLYKNQDVFSSAALIHYGQDVLTSLPHQPTFDTGYATPEWFTLLAAPMQLGRIFEETEALNAFNPVVILSYRTWRDEFDSDLDILDKKVSFSGVSYRVIGVLGEKFIEPQIKQRGIDVGIWFPWDYNLDSHRKESWGSVSAALTFVGKLKDRFSSEQAEKHITPLVNDTWIENVASDPFFSGWSVDMKLHSFQSVILGDSRGAVFLLLAGVFGLVLISFANICNLFMARTAQQRRQLAIHAALGAKPSHLFLSLSAESVLLMSLASLLALAIAACGFYVLQTHLALALPRANELRLDFVTFASALLLTILFALLFAFMCSKMINYRVLNSSLQSSGKGTGVQVSKKLRQTLVASQVAIAAVLVFANISVFKEAVAVITQPSGFSVNNLTHLRLSISATKIPPQDEVVPIMMALKEKLLALPQVQNVSQSDSVLGVFDRWALTIVNTNESFTPESNRVGPDYFSMIGQPLLEGELISAENIKEGSKVLILNDVFVKRLKLDRSPLGLKISLSGPEPHTVIGVVKGILRPGETDMPIRAYIPANLATTQMTLQLKAGQTISREEVVSVISEVSSLYVLFSLDNLVDVKRLQFFTQYTIAMTTLALAIITLFLASVGLYGILSYATQMRRFELGTRMAIGAKRKDLVRLIVKDNAWVISIGMGTSMVVMLLLYIGYQDQLSAYIGVELFGMFALTICAIGALSLFACYWPLRQYINQPAIHSLRGSD